MKKTLLALIIFYQIPSTSFAARPIRGTYSVPVSDELKQFASYDVKFKDADYQSLPSQINFPLPVDLVGEPINIFIAKEPGFENVWKGPLAQGVCTNENRNFTCRIEFIGLKFDQEKIISAVNSKYPSASERAGRLSVARHFSGEPIGIITYKLRGKSKEFSD